MYELTVGAIALGGPQIDLAEAGDRDVPAIGLERDVVLQQRPGLGPAILAPPDRAFVRRPIRDPSAAD